MRQAIRTGRRVEGPTGPDGLHGPGRVSEAGIRDPQTTNNVHQASEDHSFVVFLPWQPLRERMKTGSFWLLKRKQEGKGQPKGHRFAGISIAEPFLNPFARDWLRRDLS